MSDLVSPDESKVDKLVHVVMQSSAENRDETIQIGTHTAINKMQNRFTICGINDLINDRDCSNEATHIDAVYGNDGKYGAINAMEASAKKIEVKAGHGKMYNSPVRKPLLAGDASACDDVVAEFSSDGSLFWWAPSLPRAYFGT